MRVSALYTLLLTIILAVHFSCSPGPEKEANKKAYPAFDEATSRNTDPGVVGVFRVPTLLIITLVDSAAMPDVANKVAQCYTTIGEDLQKTGATVNGAFGQIIYNNDSANFKFACFAPIRSVPAADPAHCKFATMNPADMLVYNFYGPYQLLYTAYDDMRDYIKSHNLTQTGELREFYITDPTLETDSKKWLTRVMVPVAPVDSLTAN